MKASDVQVRPFSTPVLVLAIAAAPAALFSILMTPALVGVLAVIGVLAFAFSDYSRKPSFRVRRHETPSTPATDSAAIHQLDWTYTAHSA